MGTEVVVFVSETVKDPLLSFQIILRRRSGIELERPVHTLVASVFLWTSGLDAFSAYAKFDPPDRQLRKASKPH